MRLCLRELSFGRDATLAAGQQRGMQFYSGCRTTALDAMVYWLPECSVGGAGPLAAGLNRVTRC